ncbi:MAG: ribosome maturation factor RimM [Leptolyngbyaceae cyanobacterium]
MASDSAATAWLEIGRIVAPQGLDGAVRVYPDSDFPERFLEPGDRWLLKPGQSQPEPVQLVSGRYLAGKGLYVLKLAGVNHRDQAEALREAKLVVPAGDRLAVEPDEFHVSDLVGLTVRLQATGAVIGTVIDVYAAGNDLLAIELYAQAESTAASPAAKSVKKGSLPILIPFVYAIVPVVDLAAGYVEITPPPGLLPIEA